MSRIIFFVVRVLAFARRMWLGEPVILALLNTSIWSGATRPDVKPVTVSWMAPLVDFLSVTWWVIDIFSLLTFSELITGFLDNVPTGFQISRYEWVTRGWCKMSVCLFVCQEDACVPHSLLSSFYRSLLISFKLGWKPSILLLISFHCFYHKNK